MFFMTQKQCKPTWTHSLSEALMLRNSQFYISEHQLYYRIILDRNSYHRVTQQRRCGIGQFGRHIMAHWPEMWGEGSANVQWTNTLGGMSEMDWHSKEGTQALRCTRQTVIGPECPSAWARGGQQMTRGKQSPLNLHQTASHKARASHFLRGYCHTLVEDYAVEQCSAAAVPPWESGESGP